MSAKLNALLLLTLAALIGGCGGGGSAGDDAVVAFRCHRDEVISDVVKQPEKGDGRLFLRCQLRRQRVTRFGTAASSDNERRHRSG